MRPLPFVALDFEASGSGPPARRLQDGLRVRISGFMRCLLAAVTALAVVAAIDGCGGGGEKVSAGLPPAPDKIKLSSPAFAAGATIPKQFTCDGQDVSPPLRWSGVPSGAHSLALIVEDPDAPGGTFVHWTLYEIDAGLSAISQGKAPPGAVQGENSFGKSGYGGPCPPKGDKPHRYMFGLYALSASPALSAGAKPDVVIAALKRTASVRGVLSAKYGR
jgi:Raf kinase inhibitor-like YbhB/YbcL family protein